MKVSFKTTGTNLDTRTLLQLSGIAQSETLQSLKRSVIRKRLLSFRLCYDGAEITYPAKDGEPILEL